MSRIREQFSVLCFAYSWWNLQYGAIPDNVASTCVCNVTSFKKLPRNPRYILLARNVLNISRRKV